MVARKKDENILSMVDTFKEFKDIQEHRPNDLGERSGRKLSQRACPYLR